MNNLTDIELMSMVGTSFSIVLRIFLSLGNTTSLGNTLVDIFEMIFRLSILGVSGRSEYGTNW